MTLKRLPAGTAQGSSASLVPGMRVAGARYLLKRLLGSGPFSEVWLAWDRTIEHEVALKFLPDEKLRELNLVEAVKQLTHRTLQLTHPAITRVYDFVQHRDTLAIAMEYIPGWSLASLKIDRAENRFSWVEIQQWTGQVCDALDYAHYEFGLAHGAIKPSNLLLNAREQCKVADFGVARCLRIALADRAKPASQMALAYLSPQQIQAAEVSPLDDIYSLGATLFDFLTGSPPFFQGDIARQVLESPVPSMNERLALLPGPPDIPEHWQNTIAACLDKNPAQRPQTVGQVLHQLRLEGGSVPRPAEVKPEANPGLAPCLTLPGPAADQLSA